MEEVRQSPVVQLARGKFGSFQCRLASKIIGEQWQNCLMGQLCFSEKTSSKATRH